MKNSKSRTTFADNSENRPILIKKCENNTIFKKTAKKIRFLLKNSKNTTIFADNSEYRTILGENCENNTIFDEKQQ
ncbi:hypothetical protein T06_4387 [Trichinella sp. T6]|nr:hypothetical protein T06_4387 [Trichinella sp. T6]